MEPGTIKLRDLVPPNMVERKKILAMPFEQKSARPWSEKET